MCRGVSSVLSISPLAVRCKSAMTEIFVVQSHADFSKKTAWGVARHNAAYASRGKTRRAQPPRGATPPSPHRSDLLLTTISGLAIPPLIYILARHTLPALKIELHSVKT